MKARFGLSRSRGDAERERRAKVIYSDANFRHLENSGNGPGPFFVSRSDSAAISSNIKPNRDRQDLHHRLSVPPIDWIQEFQKKISRKNDKKIRIAYKRESGSIQNPSLP